MRTIAVLSGGAAVELPVAAFALSDGGAACLQLTDVGPLRRGGTYLVAREGEPGLAPRFDELFRQAARLARDPAGQAALEELLERAREVARATQPRLEPAALEGLAGLLARARALEPATDPEAGPWSLEALTAAIALIFVSEEERYPRPRYQGCDVALGRFLDCLPGRGDSPEA
ncbi:MAG: hypothetical protein R3F62_19830 [Planctomycetota bacterium]